MASVVSHAFLASAVGAGLPRDRLPRRYVALGAVLAACPDLDTIGFWAGVPYESAWGHRGLTHSLPFAVLVALVATVAVVRLARRPPRARLLFAYLLFCVGTHGLLDAMTDGGLGIALAAPFSHARWFLPFRPLEVAPLALEPFFGPRGARVLLSEMLFVWLPAVAAGLLLRLAHAARRRRAAGAGSR